MDKVVLEERKKDTEHRCGNLFFLMWFIKAKVNLSPPRERYGICGWLEATPWLCAWMSSWSLTGAATHFDSAHPKNQGRMVSRTGSQLM